MNTIKAIFVVLVLFLAGCAEEPCRDTAFFNGAWVSTYQTSTFYLGLEVQSDSSLVGLWVDVVPGSYTFGIIQGTIDACHLRLLLMEGAAVHGDLYLYRIANYLSGTLWAPTFTKPLTFVRQ